MDRDGTRMTPLLEDPGQVRAKRFPRSKLVGSPEFRLQMNGAGDGSLPGETGEMDTE